MPPTVPLSSGDGPSVSHLGVVTQEYVSTPYGVGRLLLPFAPRTDGIALVSLPWAVAAVSERDIERLDNYKQQQREQKKAAEAAERQRAKEVNATKEAGGGAIVGGAVVGGAVVAVRNVMLSAHAASLAKVDFPDMAPLNVPMYRRRQTFAVLLASSSCFLCVVLALICIRSSGIVCGAFLAYMAYILLAQDYHCNGRGLKSDWFRRLTFWSWFKDYFPVSLHVTTPLDPTQKYIFCYHPHGILSLGAFLNFGSEATGFSEKLPGIDLNVLTLTANFQIPFYGIFLSLMGIADASRESCNACLSRGPGAAILLVLGGAKESLDAHPHRDYDLTLHRKGFVKVALENGADLVPVFSFGETDVWDQMDNPRGSTLRKVQDRLQQKLGFALPAVKGRGIWNYSFGLLPFRRPITTFVGPPLVLPRVTPAEITDELITSIHTQYKAALEVLFNRYKGTFAPHRRLHFVGEPAGARGHARSDANKKEN